MEKASQALSGGQQIRVSLTFLVHLYLEFNVFGFISEYIWSLVYVLFFGVVNEMSKVNFHQGTEKCGPDNPSHF